MPTAATAMVDVADAASTEQVSEAAFAEFRFGCFGACCEFP